MKILDEIGKTHKTDKSSIYHDYLNKYQKYLPFARNQKIKILEIGVAQGSSLKTWSDYFYNSNVVGIDINLNCKQYETEKIKIEIGDQSDISFLQNVCAKYGFFDLIIDDGSHFSDHVIKSFDCLFNYLNSGGVYIIEDVCCSYWKEYNGGKENDNSLLKKFHKIIDEVNFLGEKANVQQFCIRKDSVLLNQFEQKSEKYIGTQIESINFLNSIILITKR